MSIFQNVYWKKVVAAGWGQRHSPRVASDRLTTDTCTTDGAGPAKFQECYTRQGKVTKHPGITFENFCLFKP